MIAYTQKKQKNFYNHTVFTGKYNDIKSSFFKKTPILVRVATYMETYTDVSIRDIAKKQSNPADFNNMLCNRLYLEMLVDYIITISDGEKATRRINTLVTKLWDLFMSTVLFNHPSFKAQDWDNKDNLKTILINKCKTWKNTFQKMDLEDLSDNDVVSDLTNDSICKLYKKTAN